MSPASTPSCSARYERPSVGIETGSIAKNPREAKTFSCAARPRRVRAGFEFTKSISAKLRLNRPIKYTHGILRSINTLPMMERTVLFYDFHRQYRMPRSKNVLRLGQNRSLGPTGPISSGGPSGYGTRGGGSRAGCMRYRAPVRGREE